MLDSPSELDAFKRDIDLRQYAATKGYQLDPRESWRGSAVMRLGGRGGDKIIVKRGENGHYLYFSVRDDGDNGTIIDFIQHRDRLSLGAIRKELRPWIGQPVSPALPIFPALEKTSRDREKVEREFAAMDASTSSSYLEASRCLPIDVLNSPRFRGCYRVDGHSNVAFPHFDEHHELCGYELKNERFTSFAAGGEKGLWLSREFPDDRRLVFCESAIECLSYASLFRHAATRYASVGGKLNPRQPGLIAAAISRMPAASEVVAGMNADDEGRALAAVVRAAFDHAVVPKGRFTLQEPLRHKDWNDELRAIVPPD